MAKKRVLITGGAGFLDVLRTHPELRPQLAAAAARLADVEPERVLERAERHGIRFVIPGDDEWPTQLEDLGHAGALNERGEVPVGLWVKGPLRLDRLAESVAVVGSRSSTTYGDQVAGDLAAVVAQSGRPVVSGAAFGIDYAAGKVPGARGNMTLVTPDAEDAAGAFRKTAAVILPGVDAASLQRAIASDLSDGAPRARLLRMYGLILGSPEFQRH